MKTLVRGRGVWASKKMEYRLVVALGNSRDALYCDVLIGSLVIDYFIV